MGLAILVGVACAECLRRVRAPCSRRRVRAGAGILVTALLIAAMYAQYAPAVGVPPPFRRSALPTLYPLAPAIGPESPFLRILQQAEGPLLELPVGVVGRGVPFRLANPVFHARAMYRSIFHWRPLLNGYSSYWPAGFLRRMRVAERLPGPEAVLALHRQTDLSMILVHAGKLSARKRKEWLSLADRGGRHDLRLIERDGEDLLFAVVYGGR
jgi:hypothetical protein